MKHMKVIILSLTLLMGITTTVHINPQMIFKPQKMDTLGK